MISKEKHKTKTNMKQKLILSALLLTAFFVRGQVGMNCQYVPGIQLGSTTVKSEKWGKYHYGAGLATMMIDRMTDKWYVNMDMNSLYYSITQMNRGKYAKIAKNEGGLFGMRIGHVWGNDDSFRAGFSLNGGWMQSNIDSVKTVSLSNGGVKGFYNYGLGLIAYKKIGENLHTMAKIGYEKLKYKSTQMDGRQIYIETTIGYRLLDSYGLSVMPCLYMKKYQFNSQSHSGGDAVLDNGKSTTFVLRMGLTKFF
jgi:hypothetical protein